jgi:hypothetical protein
MAEAEALLATLRSRERPADCAAAGKEVPEAVALDRLRTLLEEQSLAALDEVQRLESVLRHVLGTSTYGTLRSHVGDLRFSEAAQLLSKANPVQPPDENARGAESEGPDTSSA